MRIKPKKCKLSSCQKLFTPTYTSIQPCCSIQCTLAYNKENEAKKESEDWKVKKAVMVEGLKKMGDYEKDLQTVINAMSRLIDEGCMCISCGLEGKFSAGHFHSRGHNTTLRFNLHNVHLQCFQCNGPKGGNIPRYNLGLIDWYGKDYQEYVEYVIPLDFPLLKWTKNDLILWTAKAKTYMKEIIKLNRPFDEKDRIYWRTYYNNKLGIYINKEEEA